MSEKKSLTESFNAIKEKYHSILAYTLVILLPIFFLLEPLFDIKPDSLSFKITVAGILILIGLVIVDMLMSIHKNTSRLSDNNLIKGHDNATDKMKNILLHSLKKNRKTRINIIGVSLHDSWLFLEQSIFPKISESGFNGKLILELALVDSDYLKSMSFNDWSCHSESTKQNIIRYKEQYKKLFDSGLIEISAYYYGSIPQRHGILIDDKHLFLSNSDVSVYDESDGQKKYTLTVGINGYRVFRRAGDLSYIQRFNRWLEYFKSVGTKLELSSLDSGAKQFL